MKKIIILTVILLFVSAVAFANNNSAEVSNMIINTASVKIINDTDADVEIHTGSGFVEINKTSSTSISCEAGKEIRLANKGKKGDVLFVIDDSMCGKTVKLSKYM
jgi:predicted S18 family serine protease